MQGACAAALPRPSACCPSCWRRRHRPIRVRGRGTDAQLAAVRRRGQRHVHDGAGAARLRPPEGPEHQALRGEVARHRRREDRLVVHQLRRPRRHGRRHASRRRAPTRSPALNEHFDIIGMDPRGVGPERALDRLQGQPGDDGIYSQPFTTPDNLNPRALVSKDLRYIARAPRSTARSCRTCRRPTWRATSTCCARPLGEQQDHVLRLLLRDVPGVDVREPVPAQLPRHGPRRAGGRRLLHQRSALHAERSERRLRARARALLRGLRGRRGGVPWLR